MIKNLKVRETLSSGNFLVSIITIFVFALNANGAGIPEDTPASIVDAFSDGNLGSIATVIFLNLINPIFRIVKQKEWSWGFLKNQNFWFQIGTAIVVGVGMYGLVFPETAIGEIITAVTSKDIGLIISALAINIINPLIHFFKPAKGEKIRRIDTSGPVRARA